MFSLIFLISGSSVTCATQDAVNNNAIIVKMNEKTHIEKKPFVNIKSNPLNFSNPD
jgi:hypothetical protein